LITVTDHSHKPAEIAVGLWNLMCLNIQMLFEIGLGDEVLEFCLCD
jgi:hypothetical protein